MAALADGQRLKPPFTFDGDKSKWTEWSTKMRAYIKQLEPDLHAAMGVAATRPQPITNAMIQSPREAAMNSRLYYELT